MPLLTVTNLITSPIAFQDSTGLSSLSFQVPGSGTDSNRPMTLAQLASIEAQLIAEATAGNITWQVSDDPNSQADTLPENVVTVLLTPYNAVAGDQDILTNLTIAGAVSVVLSAAAKLGQVVRVIDGKGDAGANNITITVASAGTINGGANVVINTNRGQAFLLKTGTNAWVSVSSAAISSGAAGGDLTGTYPNPTIAANAVTEAKLATTVASAPSTLSGAGTLDVTKRTALFTSTGAGQAVSLPNGTRAGQRLSVIHTVDGGSGIITPVSAGNFATVTLTNRWENAEFEWSGTVWNVVAASPVAIVA